MGDLELLTCFDWLDWLEMAPNPMAPNAHRPKVMKLEPTEPIIIVDKSSAVRQTHKACINNSCQGAGLRNFGSKGQV